MFSLFLPAFSGGFFYRRLKANACLNPDNEPYLKGLGMYTKNLKVVAGKDQSFLFRLSRKDKKKVVRTALSADVVRLEIMPMYGIGTALTPTIIARRDAILIYFRAGQTAKLDWQVAEYRLSLLKENIAHPIADGRIYISTGRQL